MRAIIFGGTGFFGKQLVEILLNEGHSVSLVTRGNQKIKEHENLSFIKADRYNLDELKKALGKESWDIAYDQLGFCSRDSQILCEALDGKIDHLIFTSSKSVYDYGENITEESFRPDLHVLKMGERSDFDYAEGKRQAETYLAKHANFSVGYFRPPVVVGLGDTSQRWEWHKKKMKKGEEVFFPNLEAYFCLISSLDAGNVLYRMGIKRISGALNFYSLNPKLSELIKSMEEGVGHTMNLAEEASDENHSPYGAKENWFMSREKATALGIESITDCKELFQTLSRD